MPRTACKPLSMLMFCCVLSWGAGLGWAQLPLDVVPPDDERTIDFDRDIQPLLQRNCVACHQAQQAEGGLVLETHQGLLTGGDSGPAVVPDDAEASLVLRRATGREEPLMPPEDNDVGAQPLTPQQLGLLQRWIEQGAKPGDDAAGESFPWQAVPAPLQPIYAVAGTADGRFVACGRGNQVAVYDLHSGHVAQLVDPRLPTELGPAAAHRDLVQSIALATDGRQIVTGGFRTVKWWRPTDPRLPRDDAALTGAAGLVAPSPDSRRLALVNPLGDIEIWDRNENQRLRTLAGRGGRIVALAWTTGGGSDGGECLLSADADGRIRNWDAADGTTRWTIDTQRVLRAASATRDGNWVAAIDSGQRIALWRVSAADAGSNQPGSPTAVSVAELDAVADATTVAFLPGETPRLAIGTQRGVVLVHDVKQEKTVAQIAHGAPLTALAASGDGRRIVSGGADGKTRLWNVADGKEIAVAEILPGHEPRVAKAQRDSLRQQAAVVRLGERTEQLEKRAASEAEARDAAQAQRDQAAEEAADAQQQVDAAAAELAALDAKQPAADSDEGDQAKQHQALAEKARQALDAAEKAQQEKQTALQQHELALRTAVQVAQRAAEAVAQHQAQLQQARQWESELAHRLASLLEQQASAAAVAAVALDDDGTSLAVAYAGGGIRIYASTDGALLSRLPGSGQVIDGLAFLDDQTLCAFGQRSIAAAWTLTPHWQLQYAQGEPDDSPISDRVTAIDIRPDGLSFAIGSGPPSRFGEVQIFAAGDGSRLRDLGRLHGDCVLSVRFSPDGRTLACASTDRTISLVDVGTGNVIRVLEGHTHHVLSLAWQDDGQTLASASADLTVKLWDPATGQQQRTLTDFPKEVTAVAFLGTTAQLATACADGKLRLYDAATGKTLRTFGTGSDYLYAVDAAADGKWIVAGGQEGVLRIWNASDGKLLHELR